MWHFLAQAAEYDFEGAMTGADAGMMAGMGAGFMLLQLVIGLGVSALMFWGVFTKAGEPGWASLVPIYNTFVLTKISGREILWFILMLVPCVNIVAWILINIDVARKFGKGTGFGIGLSFLSIIFYPILGFGSAEYDAEA